MGQQVDALGFQWRGTPEPHVRAQGLIAYSFFVVLNLEPSPSTPI